jgi:hypothetical protein
VWQAAMMLRMEDATGLNLTALRFLSPLVSHIRMNLLEFFSVFNGHSHRHLWQAANVRRDIPPRVDPCPGHKSEMVRTSSIQLCPRKPK